ncbi:MAG: hypothetical protein HYT85_16935 [candidate division NC10 bacterium]|nr:hypothetical protein [candidate division NC10 bacterium]MBI2163166.1 hypothetical protein [candidate division NC10 bacterium]MBI3084314.1 hypothetical protein [candidate division NC10 bacterium]
MLYETTLTIEEAEVRLAASPAANRPLAAWLGRPGWVLGKLVLTGMLVMYLAGWVQDFQRIRRLEAEPTPPSKVITKYEAWERIYPRPASKLVRPAVSVPGKSAGQGGQPFPGKRPA